MIVFKQNSRFYSRNSAGKYALDVAELRGAFALSASVGERIREFRDFRLGKLSSAKRLYHWPHAQLSPSTLPRFPRSRVTGVVI